MPVKLKSKKRKNLVEFHEVEDGQLVEIIKSTAEEDIGKIAQRVHRNLVLIGEGDEESYDDPNNGSDKLRLRVLKNGEKIIVVDNVVTEEL